jgi:phosphatidylglycerophosphate synthase
VPNTYVNPANAITYSRFFTLPAFVHFWQRGEPQLALIMVMLCGFLDLFDGMAARKFNCSSGFGEFFDAAADGICYGFMLAYLAFVGALPWQPIVGIVALGGINTVGRLVYAKRLGRTTNYRSWAMERVVAFTIYLVGFGTVQIQPEFYSWSCFAVMGLVLAHDLKRMLLDPVPA